MINFEEFKEKVTLGYMPFENKLCTTMYFENFSKYIEVQLNVYVRPGQIVNMPFDKLRESISDKIYEWYEELKDELEKLYPEKISIDKKDEMIQLEFNF